MIVLITGCRSGIGFATALEAARQGHTVYAGFRDIKTSTNLAEASKNLPIELVQLDITRENERRSAVEKILKEQKKLDVLINNAGTPLGGFLEQVEEDELRKVFDVNFFGSWGMTKACLPAMRKEKYGVIIMISSMSGRMAIPGVGVYSSSKFALEGLSEAWRHELKHFGVRMTVVEPGAYKTDIFGRNRIYCRRFNDKQSPYAPYVTNLQRWYEKKAVSKAGDPKELARVIVSLFDQPRSPFRRLVGRWSGLRQFALRFLPFKVLEHVFERAIKTGK